MNAQAREYWRIRRQTGEYCMTQYDNFLDYLYECELSENTISSYRYSLKEYFSLFDEFNKTNAIKYKQWLMEHKKAGTIVLRITALNKYADFIGKPTEKIKRIKIQKRLYVENVPNDAEYQKVCEYAKEHNIRDYWIIRFLAGTGMRVSELTKLKGTCLIDGCAQMHSKGKQRVILIPKHLIKESEAFFQGKKADEPLFLSKYGTPLSERGVDQQLKLIGKKAGVRKEVMHPHAFRHYFAIKMLKATGNDISIVSSYLGHSNITTTAIYTMRTKEEHENLLNAQMTW